jgi:hypothetical protein
VTSSRKGTFRSSQGASTSGARFRSASLRGTRLDRAPLCSVCAKPLPEGERAHETVDGALAWSRGERLEVERVRQCESCASGLALTMMRRFEGEDDGG